MRKTKVRKYRELAVMSVLKIRDFLPSMLSFLLWPSVIPGSWAVLIREEKGETSLFHSICNQQPSV